MTTTLTSRERIARILRRQPVDRVGLFEVFWRETAQAWARQGHLQSPEQISDHFGLDLRRTSGEITPGSARALTLVADLDAGETMIEETADARLVRDGNGAVLRWKKGGSGAPEHVDFLVKDRAGWEAHIRPRLLDARDYERRIDFGHYRALRSRCAREQRFLACGVVAAFDLMTPMCGHEHLLAGMALDGGWVRDMADAYTGVTIDLLEMLFEREGLPDGLWAWDDLGFKTGPFMSPAMYRAFILPAHKRLFDFAHSKGLPVILHSDGCLKLLLPSLIEAGIDCLQPLEAKAGMHLPEIKAMFGHRIALIGGMDVRALETNDRAVVEDELRRKLPAAMAGGGYVLQVDHSVTDRVHYETYRYFVERGLAIGTY